MQRKLKWLLLIMILLMIGMSIPAFATTTVPTIDLNINPAGTNQETAGTIQIIILLTILSIAPSILIMTTCFTRFIIVFSFVRKALSLQTVPPN
jgi:flagellar biosynthetic protein FliP